MSAPHPPPVAIVVPDRIEPGVYANVVNVWHTPTDFTLDFLVQTPGGAPVQLPDGTSGQAQRLLAVARVKLPPAQIFELMKALERQLTAFESAARQGDDAPPTGDHPHEGGEGSA